LEHDRRVLLARIVRIKQELDDVQKTRRLQREARQRVPFPVVALVGYTNAGKSTLFNAMTGAQVMAEDMLFATLDPTVRALSLPHGQQVLLSDTVGFVSDLPTMLVAAFHATLEEVQQAQFILHVRDIAHPDTEAQAKDVETTLRALGLDPHDKNHVVEVWNKADKLAPERRAAMATVAQQSGALFCSALTGWGCEALQSTLLERFAPAVFDAYIACPSQRGDVLAWLQAKGRILQCEPDETSEQFRLHVRLPAKQKVTFDDFCKDQKLTPLKPFRAQASA
jgi:GTP-binding protein HflX